MADEERSARRKVLEAAYRLFYRRGFVRVGVEEIAAAAGVTKRTLYYHFASKDDLLAAVLDRQRQMALELIRTWAPPADGGNASASLDSLFASLRSWMLKPRWSGSGYTRIVVELADLPGHPARRIARVHKAEVEATYCQFLHSHGIPEAAARARELVIVIEGAMIQTLFHGGATYVDAGLEMLRDRIFARPLRAPPVKVSDRPMRP
jgi:AcrR family transcriptional regulator